MKYLFLILSLIFFLLYLPILVLAQCPPACPSGYECGGTVNLGTHYGCFVGSGETQNWYTDLSTYTKVNISATLSMDADDDLDLTLYDPTGFPVSRSETRQVGAPEKVSACGDKGVWKNSVYSYSIIGGYGGYSITITAKDQECCSKLDCPVPGSTCKDGKCVLPCFPDGATCSKDSDCCSGICNINEVYGSRCCKQACQADGFACSGSNVVYKDYYCDSAGDCTSTDSSKDTSKPDSSGFIRDWLILGPFRDIDCGCGTCYNPAMQGYSCDNWFDFSATAPQGEDKTAGQTWFIHHNNDGLVDFESEVFGSGVIKDDVTAFAFAYVYSPEARDVQLAVGSDDGITVWLNGALVINNPAACRGVGTDQDIASVKLNKGSNRLLIRIGENTGGWGFRARFKFPDGTPVTDINVSIPANSYNCANFNGWVTQGFSSNCCNLYNYTYYASYSCSGASCMQTASSSSTTKIADINTGLACGTDYCSVAYGYNRTCSGGSCSSFIKLNCTDNYGCTADSCTGAASGCSYCVQQGWANSTCSSPTYPCCSGLTLKSCPIGNVCCPPDSYSSWYYLNPCRRYRYKYTYSCPSVEGGSCSSTTVIEYENVNEGSACDAGSYECKDSCTKGRKLYTCQVGSCLPSGQWAGLVGYWKFNEGSGNKAYDSSGYGNNGTLYGGLDTTGWTTGKFGSALNFDGSNDYIEVPNSNSLQVSAQLNVEAWIYINIIQSRMVIAGKHYMEYEFIIDSSGSMLKLYKFDNNTNSYESAYASFSFQPKQWYHVAVTMNGTQITFYINGVKYPPSGYEGAPMSFGTIPSTYPVDIGRRVWGGNYFNGIIDEVKIYNYALTEQEILQEYVKGPSYNFASCSPYRCSGGSCSNTCYGTCGADPGCSEKTQGSTCDGDRICDENCKCVYKCDLPQFQSEATCPSPDCKWCKGDNKCKKASNVLCQPGECFGSSRYCGNDCTWSYCPGTNAACYCDAGTCKACPGGGNCVSYACQLTCPVNWCGSPAPTCYPPDSCWTDYICKNGNWVNHIGDGICNCGETRLDSPNDCITYPITLFRGWNLISIPYKKISKVESETCGVEKLPFYYWNNSIKQWNEIYGITNLKYGEAYWVNPQWHLGKEFMPLFPGCYINISATATDAGSVSDLPDLVSGYNHMGAAAVNQLAFPKGDCQISAGPLYWDAATQNWTSAPYMDAGRGYWIYTINNCKLG